MPSIKLLLTIGSVPRRFSISSVLKYGQCCQPLQGFSCAHCLSTHEFYQLLGFVRSADDTTTENAIDSGRAIISKREQGQLRSLERCLSTSSEHWRRLPHSTTAALNCLRSSCGYFYVREIDKNIRLKVESVASWSKWALYFGLDEKDEVLQDQSTQKVNDFLPETCPDGTRQARSISTFDCINQQHCNDQDETGTVDMGSIRHSVEVPRLPKPIIVIIWLLLMPSGLSETIRGSTHVRRCERILKC